MAAVEKRGLQPDLLLTDLMMPGMNGRELAERLRQDHPKLKVLYMSGYTSNTLGDQGDLAPDAVILQKPFGSSALASAVRKALESP